MTDTGHGQDRRGLRGRTALVTGGSRGIGRAVVTALAARGARVAFTYRRDREAADDLLRQVCKEGGQVHAHRADAEDLAGVERLVEEIHRDVGAVDLLVSNAGGASRGRRIAETSADEFQHLMSVHALGPVQLIRALLPDLRAAGRADVVVISSAISSEAPPFAAPYTMAKAAMEAAARTLAREERPHGVRVNVVAPGLVATDMGERLVRASAGVGVGELDQEAPFGRVCRPEDVAEVVAFLATDAAAYVSGQRINVDAGGPDTTIY
ncbi:SDR family NAD(P)-dependent oxidoreductase [Streptomyces ipomoeae]|uniref:SDR family NAD(P)-dependent oxidoreductase n=1 Tax=Streptomyces ipomoeae TaxID=103232 RepID=UPI0011476353|nr:SDR family oxidoreductase [Streptomyces ipomoeae]MDX2937780.1 SDR family oxidoreductase [Streptomyces ipomoeae]TQE17215.1 SDR family oxidoreductase [Streptomyces ipomoeae]